MLSLEIKDQYYNMREQIEPYPEVIEKAMEAMRMSGVIPLVRPIRGGTDGAQLSYRGLPLSEPVHGRDEFSRQIRILLGRHHAKSRSNHRQFSPSMGHSCSLLARYSSVIFDKF